MTQSLLTNMRSSNPFMRISASVSIITFLMLILMPTAMAAQTINNDPAPKNSSFQNPSSQNSSFQNKSAAAPGVEAELSETIQKIQKKMGKLQEKIAKKQDAGLEKGDLKDLHEKIKELDKKVVKAFNKTEQHLKDKGLSNVIMKRHTDMVVNYRGELATMLQNLSGVELAKDDVELEKKVKKAKEHLDSKKHKRSHQPFDPNNMPFSVPDGKVRKPRKTKKEFQSSLNDPKPVQIASTVLSAGMLSASAVATSLLPQPEDLLPTEDVQITDEIKALALQLENNPVKIYNWVHNNIEFIPTYGSIQGSQMTLETKKGNAFDTSSLLIALLRASGVPARYAIGTVKIPMDKVMNWVGGVTVPDAAIEIMGQGGIPNIGVTRGGNIVAVEIEHIWVDAFVDSVPSRGTKNIAGDTWIPLDASYKQYEYVQGIDYKSVINIDTQEFINQISSSAQINEQEGWVAGVDQVFIDATFVDLKSQLENYISINNPNATVDDLFGVQNIIFIARSDLALSLPYKIIIKGSQYTELPNNLRNKFKIELYDTEINKALGLPVLSYTASLPQLSDKKITLTFSPSTQNDKDLLNSYFPDLHADGTPVLPNEWPESIPGYLLNLKAELRINGNIVVNGGEFSAGSELPGNMSLWSIKNGWEVIPNPWVVGEVYAIDINTGGVSNTQIAKQENNILKSSDKIKQGVGTINREELVGDVLYSTILGYFSSLDTISDLMSKFSNSVRYRLPSFGYYSQSIKTDYLFGLPINISGSGLVMDIDRSSNITVSKDYDEQNTKLMRNAIGIMSSMLENKIPEIIFSDPQSPVRGVSAMEALIIANEMGYKIFEIDSNNMGSILPMLNIDVKAKNDIINAIATGKVVTVPENNITVGGWTGVGFVINDPESGVGAYLISGGQNGSFLPVLASVVTTVKETWLVGAAGNNVYASFLTKVGIFFAALGSFLNILAKCPFDVIVIFSVILAVAITASVAFSVAFVATAGLAGVAAVLAQLLFITAFTKVVDKMTNTVCK